MARPKKSKKMPAKKAVSRKTAVKKTTAKAVAATKCPCYEKMKAFFTEDRKKLIFAFLLGALCIAFIWHGFSLICAPQKMHWERKSHSKIYREQQRKAVREHAAMRTAGCKIEGMEGTSRKMAPAGCPIEMERRSKYIESEYAPYLKPGTAQIVGTVLQKSPRGGRGFVPVIEQFEVFANPVTSYSQEWFMRNWVGNENLKAPDSRALKTNFKARVAQDGSFSFVNLPKGEYFVVARGCVKFDPNQKQCTPVRYGKRVRVDNNQRTSVGLDIVAKGR